MEILQDIPDNSIDVVIADPPYGMNFRSNHRKERYEPIFGDDMLPIPAMIECLRVARKAVYMFCRWNNLGVVGLPEPKSVIAWVKNNWSMGDLKHEHGRQWEAICFYPQEEHEFITRIPDVIVANRTGNLLHPTQKPVDLIQKLIACNKCDSILDPFMGSGTTIIASIREGKQYIGIECDKEHYDTAVKRVDNELSVIKMEFDK